MGLNAEDLIARLDFATRWPIDEDETDARRYVERWIAFRENDREALRDIAEWQSTTERYKVDPLPERVSGAFASLLFGREPTVKVAEGNPQDRMAEIMRENRFGSRLRSAEETCSSEGEVWWRLVADPGRLDTPGIEWHSRLDVIPHYVAQQARAVAFINRLDDPDGDDEQVWRHFEVHDEDSIHNVLYLGTESAVGDRVNLERHPQVEELADEWTHEVGGMLAGRVINVEGTDMRLGKSDYDGIEDHFLELNECFMTGGKNRGLTALQRAYGPQSAVDETGALPEGLNFMAVDDTDMAPGMTTGDKFGVLNFSFDAEALIRWARHIATTALSRRGITPQFTGDATDAEGYAQTGVALRMRLIPSTNEGDRRAAPWNDELDTILLRVQQIDARPESDRGYSQSWPKVDEAPAVSLGDALPVDEIEDATRISTLRSADALSIEQAVRERNPDWDEDQITEEVARIKADHQDQGAGMFGNGPGAPAEGDEEGEGEPFELPEEGTIELGMGVSVTATEDAFEVVGLPAPE